MYIINSNPKHIPHIGKNTPSLKAVFALFNRIEAFDKNI